MWNNADILLAFLVSFALLTLGYLIIQARSLNVDQDEPLNETVTV